MRIASEKRFPWLLVSASVFALTMAGCGSSNSSDNDGSAGAPAAGAGTSASGGSPGAAGAGGSSSGSGGAAAGAAGAASFGGNPNGGAAGMAAAGGAMSESMIADGICAKQCDAGCQLIPTHPEECLTACEGIFSKALVACQSQAVSYIACLQKGGPIYYCGGYSDSSPCATEAHAMIDCYNAKQQ